MPSLTGKVAFITGAARGQGRSHAIRLAEEGAHLVLVDACRTLETVPYPMATSDDLVETTSLATKPALMCSRPNSTCVISPACTSLLNGRWIASAGLTS